MKFPKPAFLASAFAMVLVTNHGGQVSATDLQQAAVIRIVDGDTLAVDGMPERIRLYGIDAPEDGQFCFDLQRVEYDCGARASAALTEPARPWRRLV
jgi:succinoglycan biosynthesis protein ExoI